MSRGPDAGAEGSAKEPVKPIMGRMVGKGSSREGLKETCSTEDSSTI